MRHIWIVMEIGCLECGKASRCITVSETKAQAEEAQTDLRARCEESGLDYQIFPVPVPHWEPTR